MRPSNCEANRLAFLQIYAAVTAFLENSLQLDLFIIRLVLEQKLLCI